MPNFGLDSLTAEHLLSLWAPASAMALLGLGALLAHTVSRRWLERSDPAYAPLVAATSVITLAWLISAALRSGMIADNQLLISGSRLLSVALIVTILFLWYRSATAPVWRALRGNPRGVWQLGIPIGAATGRAIGYALAASVVSGTVLALEPAFSLGFWVTASASLTLAIRSGALACILVGPVLAVVALLLPIEAGVAVAGFVVILVLAISGISSWADGELA